MPQFEFLREIGSVGAPDVDYTLCSLVTDHALYQSMVQSFVEAGFTPDRCEYLFADNTAGNRADGYRGLNRMIAAARGRIVILVHQDVLAVDSKERLDAVLHSLDRTAPDWAVAGNAGFDPSQWAYLRTLTESDLIAPLADQPARQAVSLDENLLILRKDALLGFSHDLGGFHLYATDLVLQANLRGRTAWVVDFHVEHSGRGKIDQSFVMARDAIERKYRAAFRGRTLRTPITWLELGRRSVWTRLARLVLASQVRGGWRKPVVDALLALRSGPRAVLGVLPLAMACRIDGVKFRVPADAPVAVRVAMQAGTYRQDLRDMIGAWLPEGVPVVLLGGSYGVIDAALRRKVSGQVVIAAETGAGLQDAVSKLGPAGAFALVCDLDGGEFDLVQHQATVLDRCAAMIIQTRPAALHDRGLSVHALCRRVTQAGFGIVAVAGTVIVATRG